MKTTASFSAKAARFCVCALLLGLAVPLAAHPAGDYLPQVEGSVTLLTPDLVKDAPFLPDAKSNPLFLKYEDMLAKLEAKHIKLNVHSLAVFGEGFLMNSSASPATIRYILKYKILGEQIAWTETGDADHPAFNLTVPDGGSFRITFPAKDWLLCAVNTRIPQYLVFNPELILHGQVRRLVTFALYPPSTGFLAFIAIYFYYWIGSTLEQYWGTGQFTIYFFSGLILTVL